jgi:hypothetical protein
LYNLNKSSGEVEFDVLRNYLRVRVVEILKVFNFHSIHIFLIIRYNLKDSERRDSTTIPEEDLQKQLAEAQDNATNQTKPIIKENEKTE